jgi:hypothetical protein
VIDLPDEYLYPLKKLREHYRRLISDYTGVMESLAEQMRVCSEKLQESEDAFNHVNCLIPIDSDSPTDELLNGYVDMALASEIKQQPDESESIKEVLAQYPGTLCDVKFIVRMLYETPTADAHDRIAALLESGKQERKWYSVPDNPTCYTIDASLIPVNTVERRGRKKRA